MAHGLHHVTAIAGPAARNRSFHADLLGQRLVKRTVNFDDPGTWHLYYGDRHGAPGSILTFFPWDHVAPGRAGVGETAETGFRVPVAALPFWRARLAAAGIVAAPVAERFGAPVLAFADPDGLRLALVGLDGIDREPAWTSPDLGTGEALRGFHGVTLTVADPAPTAAILTDVLGFTELARDGAVTRFVAQGTGMGAVVDLHAAPGLPRGRQGGGSVHHVAFRAADDAEQAAMVRKLRENHGIATTEQKDRNYFRSVYLREPGGVVFEIATDEPGFAVDEPEATLGEGLMLPRFLEGRRAAIEAVLPVLA